MAEKKENDSRTRSAAYVVDARCKIDQFWIPVASFTVQWGVNMVPEAEFVLPVVTDQGGRRPAVILNSLDFSKVGADTTLMSVYDLAKKAKDEELDCEFAFDAVQQYDDGTSGTRLFLFNNGELPWRVTHVEMQPQSRIAPAGVRVIVSHPMSKLEEMPGYFYVGTTGFMEKVSDEVGGAKDVVQVADKVLDVVVSEMETSQKSEFKGYSVDNETLKAVAATRLCDWIDAGECTSFPYTRFFPDPENASEACKMALGEYFFTVGNGTPFGAFMRFCSDSCSYMRIDPWDKKASLKILDPWNRTDVKPFDDQHVVSTRIVDDAQPVCGIRVRGVVTSNAGEDTLNGLEPSDSRKSESIYGDVLYYYRTKGAILTAGVPEFARKAVGYAARLKRAPSGKEDTFGGRLRIASDTSFDNTLVEDLREISGNVEAGIDTLTSIQEATAESMFAVMYRKSARVAVSLPPVFPDDGIPKVGEFRSVNAGTGNNKVVGMVVAVYFTGSVSSGDCTITAQLGYVGDAPELSGGGVPRNRIWQ